MASAKEIIEKACSYIGTHGNPVGSNNVIFNADYYGIPVWGDSYPWCCAYVWDIFRMCGASDLFYYGQRTAYCPTVDAWAQNEGLCVGYDSAQYGDIVLFDWDGDNVADHIGFVIGMNSDGSLHTVEGNTSDASHSNGDYVLERTRYRQNVLRIIRPEYGGSDGFYFTTDEIKEGDTGIDVWRWQMCLKSRGYYKGDIDRYFSAELTKATVDWQKKAGLDVDGRVGNRQSWPTMFGLERDGNYWIIYPTKIGEMKSKDVLLPQEILKASGYYTGALDWDFGPKMQAAVIKFQNAAKLPTTGELDYATLRYLIGDK